MPWKFFYLKNRWEPFDPEANVTLNEALSQDRVPQRVVIDHWWGKDKKKCTQYTVDFVMMMQWQDNGTQRRVTAWLEEDWNVEFDFLRHKVQRDEVEVRLFQEAEAAYDASEGAEPQEVHDAAAGDHGAEPEAVHGAEPGAVDDRYPPPAPVPLPTSVPPPPEPLPPPAGPAPSQAGQDPAVWVSLAPSQAGQAGQAPRRKEAFKAPPANVPPRAVQSPAKAPPDARPAAAKAPTPLGPPPGFEPKPAQPPPARSSVYSDYAGKGRPRPSAAPIVNDAEVIDYHSCDETEETKPMVVPGARADARPDLEWVRNFGSQPSNSGRRGGWRDDWRDWEEHGWQDWSTPTWRGSASSSWDAGAWGNKENY